jgi:hypothetical protein
VPAQTLQKERKRNRLTPVLAKKTPVQLKKEILVLVKKETLVQLKKEKTLVLVNLSKKKRE